MVEAASFPGETARSSLLSFEALDRFTSQGGAAASRSSQLHRAMPRSVCPSQRRRHWHFFGTQCASSHTIETLQMEPCCRPDARRGAEDVQQPTLHRQ